MVALALGTCGSGAVAQDASANWVQCRVLQYKLNRLYFDIGEESLVFEGNRAVVMRKRDTLWSGVIAKSFEGVSVSERTVKPISIKSVNAYVQAAEIDSHAVIRIGTTMSQSALGMMPMAGLDSISVLTHGLVDSVVVRRYADPQSMQVDFQSGGLDGVLAFDADGSSEDAIRVESSPAPFMAAIVPRGNSRLNREKILSSSLVCRIDTSLARGLFDAGGIRFMSRLNGDADYSAWYGFDPERGKRMLRASLDRSAAVRFYVPDNELRKLAGYLADLLARDQYRSTMVQTAEESDLSIVFVPVNRQAPEVATRAMLALIGSGSIAGLAEPIKNVNEQLQIADTTSAPETRSQSLAEAERILVEEIGCCPLFVPTIQFVCHKNIRGLIFSADGVFDPTGLMRVKPVVEAGR